MPAKPRPFKRAGLHRLECPDCPCYGYFTVAMLERLPGLPACLAAHCPGTLVPAELELAMLLGAECAVVDEYRREVLSAQHGQAGASGCGRRDTSGWRTPELIAAMRVESRRRDVARSNRLAAIAPVPTPMPF
jgi:hypothetical protein